MSRRSDDSLASLALVNRLVDTGAQPLKAGEFWKLLEQVPEPAVLLRAEGDALGELVEPCGLDPHRIATLMRASTALAFELERYQEAGVATLSPFDDAWPAALQDRLGLAAPALLHVAGPVELLAQPGLAIVGSRGVDETGAEVARSAARVAVGAGFTVVSGAARGVDQLAMAAALEAGGQVIGVLADALERTLRNADTRRWVLDGQLCLATPYKPSMGFTAANAMGRNKIIYALSRLGFVVASDHDKGGTWGGATEAMKKHIAPVAVWTGEGGGPGNTPLVSRGGIAVDDTDDLPPLLRQPPETAAPAPSSAADQLSLDIS